MSELHKRLLETPDRRESITPELVRFFKDAPEELVRFCRSFCGCVEIKVPDPKEIKKLERDVEIARLLKATVRCLAGNEQRVLICKRYGVTYRHLREVFLAAYRREMHSPYGTDSPESKRREAQRLVAKYPGQERVISEMLGLSYQEVRAFRDQEERAEPQ
jgi:hypothetical protein